MESILVTGASGFIGSFIVEEALKRKLDTWAGVRTSSSRAYLQDRKIRFLELDFARPDELRTQLSRHKEAYGKFDYIVHCAGVTKCTDKDDFDRVNFLQTQYFADALRELDMVPRQFIYISTLSVFGPVREKTYDSIREDDRPQPNTAYGISKLKAERYLQSLPGFPYLIFRPTGVYGPRERDYYLLVQSIRRHVDVAAGFRRQDITFVYVADVVQAVFLAIERQVVRRAYFISDGGVYSSRTFSNLIRRELGNPFVLRFTCPLFLFKLICYVAGFCAGRAGKPVTLNPDKYRIMSQRNWRCDIEPLVRELGYRPAYTLEQGVHATIAWYKEQDWL